MRKNLLLFFILFLPTLVSADYVYSDYNIITTLYYDQTHEEVLLEINVTSQNLSDFKYSLVGLAEDVRVEVEGYPVEASVRESDGRSEILFSLGRVFMPGEKVRIRIRYDTSSFITHSESTGTCRYSTTYSFNAKVEDLAIKFILPPGIVLVQKSGGSMASTTIFPRPETISTDGQNIYLGWTYRDLEPSERIVLWADYRRGEKAPGNYDMFFYGLFFGIILAGLVFWLSPSLLSKTKKIFPGHVLNEDEKLVFGIIEEYGGSAYQTEIVRKAGYSKGKVSKILRELEKRNLIHREIVGKRKKITLNPSIEE